MKFTMNSSESRKNCILKPIRNFENCKSADETQYDLLDVRLEEYGQAFEKVISATLDKHNLHSLLHIAHSDVLIHRHISSGTEVIPLQRPTD